MTAEQIRLECLKLAEARYGSGATDDVIGAARSYADFVLGTNDSALLKEYAGLIADLERRIDAFAKPASSGHG